MPKAVLFSQSATPNANFTAWVTGDDRFAIIPAKTNTRWIVIDRETLELAPIPEPFRTITQAKNWVTRYTRKLAGDQPE